MRHFRFSLIRAILFSAVLLFLAACDSGTAARSTVPGPSENLGAVPAISSSQVQSDPLQPVHLAVPTAGIDAPVEQVGILPNGDLATPTRNPWIDAGWYADGPHPGDKGSAVIDGHLDRPGGSAAVFWYLRNVHVGDSVLVTAGSGTQFHFHVTRIAYYTPQNAPLEDIFGNNSGKYLNLITCAGDWIPNQHQTTQRLVVYTMLDG